MGVVYIFIRTFPFWAIPLAITIITLTLGKGARHMSKKGRLGYQFGAFVLLALSGAYFVFHGHSSAVPFVHEMVYDAGRKQR